VVSYTTFSPLLENRAVFFCGPFHGLPRPGVTRHCALWSADFPQITQGDLRSPSLPLFRSYLPEVRESTPTHSFSIRRYFPISIFTISGQPNLLNRKSFWSESIDLGIHRIGMYKSDANFSSPARQTSSLRFSMTQGMERRSLERGNQAW